MTQDQPPKTKPLPLLIALALLSGFLSVPQIRAQEEAGDDPALKDYFLGNGS